MKEPTPDREFGPRWALFQALNVQAAHPSHSANRLIDNYRDAVLERGTCMTRWTEAEMGRIIDAVWIWIINANNGCGGDVDDLINAMNRNGASCPEDLEEN